MDFYHGTIGIGVMAMARLSPTKRDHLAILMVIAGCLGEWNAASARPPYRHSLKKVYGARLSAQLHQCATCHLTRDDLPAGAEFDEDAPPHNSFGDRLRQLGEDQAADHDELDIVTRILDSAGEDADGDGVPNELEILAGKQPGRATSWPDEQELLAAREAQAARALESTGYAWEPFRPIERSPVPSVQHPQWVRTPIDAFIVAEYERLGLVPAPAAAPHRLLRRVYLDLIGVPPTRAELHAFLGDTTPQAYDRVVDRLLASPEYGQRWGRHWMDIWRYSDWAGWTDGGQIRDSQPHVWRWRDWIIESLNADRPYDTMVRAMLAADELDPLNTAELRATGYLVRNYKMLSREKWMQETVEHTCKAFLGITLNCARCHDHMYDPISQEEYYQVRAIFEPHDVRIDRLPSQPDVKIDGLPRVFDATIDAPTYVFLKGDDRHPDKDRPITAGIPALLGQPLQVVPVELPVQAYYPGSVRYIREQLQDAARREVALASQEAKKKLEEWRKATSENHDPGSEATRNADLSRTRLAVASSAAAAAAAKYHALQARLAADDVRYASGNRADLDRLTQSAARGEQLANLISAEQAFLAAELAVLEANGAPQPPAVEARNAALQKWRDAIQVSQQPSNGYSPVTDIHPGQSTGRRTAFAHWLTSRDNPLVARVAANHIWNRHFGRGLVDSVFDFGQNGKVPSHPALLDWLAAELMEPAGPSDRGGPHSVAWSMKRIHRLIVTSSVYRLSAQGSSDRRAADRENRYLAHFPPRRMEAEVVRDSVLSVTEHLNGALGGPDIDYEFGFQVPRRSLYFRHAAEKEMAFLKIFDAAAVTECYQRKSSIMPQQALAMINSELTIAQARRLARSSCRTQPADRPQFCRAMFEQILTRGPADDELAACLEFLEHRCAAPTSVELATTDQDLSRPAHSPEIRAREQLIHVLLNHHEFVSIY